jgi:ubiquinone biosynthesis protein
VGLSLHPERLRRYKDVGRLLYKYGKTDLVKRAGLDEAIAGEAFAERDDGTPDQLAADLERLAFNILSSDRPNRRR